MQVAIWEKPGKSRSRVVVRALGPPPAAGCSGRLLEGRCRNLMSNTLYRAPALVRLKMQAAVFVDALATGGNSFAIAASNRR